MHKDTPANSAKRKIPLISPETKYVEIGYGRYHNWNAFAGIEIYPVLNTRYVIAGIIAPFNQKGIINIGLKTIGAP